MNMNSICFNPFMPNGLFYLKSLDMFISYVGGSGKFLLLPCFVGISELNANSIDPDQMLHSDLGLHCLPISLLWDARLKWVNDETRKNMWIPSLTWCYTLSYYSVKKI